MQRGAGCIDRRDADSPVGSDRVKRRGAFAADFVVVVAVERRSRRDVARSKGRRQEKGDRPRRACRRRRRPRAVSCSVTWPVARRRAYAANAGATSVAARRTNAVRKFAAVRSGSRWNGVCRVCGERRRAKRCSAGGRMPFASSQRLAHERHLPMAPAARRCGSPGAAPLADASHRAASRDSPPSLCRAVPAPRAARRTRSRVARRRPPDVRPSRCAGAERRECA